MKLLLICPPGPLPMDGYAPIHNHLFEVSKGLLRRGHEVLVVASQASLPEGITWIKVPEAEAEAFKEYKHLLPKMDCILDFSMLKYAYLEKEKRLELRLIGCVHPSQVYGTAPPVPYPCFVATSNAHARDLAAKLGIAVRTVYYGIPDEMIASQPPEREEERLLFLGRFISGKGPQIAVDVARRMRMGISLIGEDVKVPDQRFLIQLLQKGDGKTVSFIGHVGEDVKRGMLGAASCLLLPYLAREAAYTCLPMLEAFSRGTPVVALNEGCVMEYAAKAPPEVAALIGSSIEELPALVKASRELKREACLSAARNFTVSRAVDEYEALIKDVVENDLEW
ncbi:MAG: glycosyltransferase [Candidatus Bathyarchaeia archaeon]